VIRKRVVFAIFLGVLTVMSGAMLAGAGLIYYAGFLDGGRGCDAAALSQ